MGSTCTPGRYTRKPHALYANARHLLTRQYVRVDSVEPLRASLYYDGLVRLASKPYEAPCHENLHLRTMHLW